MPVRGGVPDRMSPKKSDDDIIPRGVCTALRCTCAQFRPRAIGPMYCADCGHSVEHHHLNSRDVSA